MGRYIEYKKKCKLSDCDINIKSNSGYGLCLKHYQRLRRYGDVNITKVEKTEHGMCYTATYNTWHSMLQRCNNPKNPSYENYGGRGIAVCDAWKKFINFYKDMGERPDGMTLDRIDNDLGYYPENCRWATRSQQMLNTRRSRSRK